MNSEQLLGVVRSLSPAAVHDICHALQLFPSDRLELLHSCMTSMHTRDALRVYLHLDDNPQTPPPPPAPIHAPELVRRTGRPANVPPPPLTVLKRRLVFA